MGLLFSSSLIAIFKTVNHAAVLAQPNMKIFTPSAICHLPSAICHLPSAICLIFKLGLIITPSTIVGGAASGTVTLGLQIVWEDAASQSLQSYYLVLFALRKLVEALFEEDVNLQLLV